MSGGATVGRLGDESTLGAGRDGPDFGNNIGEWREFVQLLRKRRSSELQCDVHQRQTGTRQMRGHGGLCE